MMEAAAAKVMEGKEEMPAPLEPGILTVEAPKFKLQESTKF